MEEGESFLQLAFIPLLLVVVLGYYSFRLLVLHDTDAIRPGADQQKKLKDKDAYTKMAGKLMLFLAVGSLVMAGLLYIFPLAAVIQILAWVVIWGVLWRRMNEKYGSK